MAFKVNIESITIPAGEYFVGDPCYGVPNERWMEWLEAAAYKDADTYLVADLDGRTVVGVQTKYGDGEYYDEQGRVYPVDAGLIGAVPVELYEPSATEPEPFGMHRVSFATDFEVARVDGVIVIGPIKVDTDPRDDNEGW